MDVVHLGLILTGGFSFAAIWQLSRLHSFRESGHRLYFRVVFYSVFLVLFSTGIHVLFFCLYSENYQNFLLQIEKILPSYQKAVSNLNSVSQGAAGAIHTAELNSQYSFSNSVDINGEASLLVISIYTFVAGFVLGNVLNLPIGVKRFRNFPIPLLKNSGPPLFMYDEIQMFRPIQKFYIWIIGQTIKNNDFETLIYNSVLKRLAIIITLENGKVYVGWAAHMPEASIVRKNVPILPVLSGYREAESHKIKFTTSYASYLKKIIEKLRESDDPIEKRTSEELGNLEIVLPVERIISSHYFDTDIYNNTDIEIMKKNQQK